MPNIIEQSPADVPLTFVKGDDFAFPVTFNGRDCTGCTFTAFVINDQTEAVVFTATVTAVNAATGAFRVTFTRAHTGALSTTTAYRWAFRETTGDNYVTKLSGRVSPRKP